MKKQTPMKANDRVFHALFGWCKIDLIGEEFAVIDSEAKTITYYVIGKGLKTFERDEDGKQIICVPTSELFLTEQEVPKIYHLKATAMNLKLTFD